MKKIHPENGNYYHIVNRGVAGIDIFRDIKDFLHFLACLKEFNTEKGIEFRTLKNKKTSIPFQQDYKPLVEIIAYCLLPHHYHILLRQIHDNGIVKYMKKIGTGYTMYFNSRYKTHGHAFQGRYLAEHIASFDALKQKAAYIHLHPLKRKEEEISDIRLDSILFQKASLYPWSSLYDYTQNTSLTINMPELKYVRPLLSKEAILPAGKGDEYLSHILEFWGKEKLVLAPRMI